MSGLDRSTRAESVFFVNGSECLVPLLGNVPHSSTFIPEDLKNGLLLRDKALAKEILALTDWYVDDLFASISAVGGRCLVYGLSRMAVDPERFEDDDREVMAPRGMGVIYTRTSGGEELRFLPSPSDRECLLKRYYRPYHSALEREVQRMLDAFGRCLILDCHSFPSRPLPYELSQDSDRPDICLGTDSFHTPRWLVEKTAVFLKAHNLKTALNRPFEGTYVPLRYLHLDKRVSSIMLEVNRGLYLNERTGEKIGSFALLKSTITDLITELAIGF